MMQLCCKSLLSCTLTGTSSGDICLTCNDNLIVNPVVAESGDQRPGLIGSYRLSGTMNTNQNSTRQSVAAAPLSAMEAVIKQSQMRNWRKASQCHSSRMLGLIAETW